MGHGRQKGVAEFYRGVKETGNLLKKIRLEIAVNEDFVEPTIQAIVKGAKTGKRGTARFSSLISRNAYGSVPRNGDPRPSAELPCPARGDDRREQGDPYRRELRSGALDSNSPDPSDLAPHPLPKREGGVLFPSPITAIAFHRAEPGS